MHRAKEPAFLTLLGFFRVCSSLILSLTNLTALSTRLAARLSKPLSASIVVSAEKVNPTEHTGVE